MYKTSFTSYELLSKFNAILTKFGLKYTVDTEINRLFTELSNTYNKMKSKLQKILVCRIN